MLTRTPTAASSVPHPRGEGPRASANRPAALANGARDNVTALVADHVLGDLETTTEAA